MSACLYATGLWWGRGTGVAKLHGKAVALTMAPALGGIRVRHIVYAPEVGVARVCLLGAHERDMSQAEIEAADALLLALCA